MVKCIVIDPLDNVAVVTQTLSAGECLEVNERKIKVIEEVPKGHKIALRDFDPGENIIKYGSPIGHAVCNIKLGEWVHTHNIKTNLEGISSYNYIKSVDFYKYEMKNITFNGYRRKSGQCGIRNELWIVPTVGCVNGIGENIIKAFKAESDAEGIDSIEIFKHNYGCSQLGEDHENTRKILKDIILHPNAGGILVLGLGCENNSIYGLKKTLGNYDTDRVKFLVCQEVGDEIAAGVQALKELQVLIKKDKREKVPISELKIGLKCGGSDGFSGITANPLLGTFSDFLISQGGTTVLTEVPEMFGAEALLMKRAENEETFQKIVELINDFKEYFIKNGQPIYENPSPGNKKGGISTLEDKSLGCTQKSGRAEVRDVLKYGDIISKRGLNLLSAPGNDLVASTALGASGCHMILFTTGRGTPFGSLVPTVKISSNTDMYKLKPHWIDFDSGELIKGESMDILLEKLVKYVVEVASGKYVNNEKNCTREIAIFKSGVTL